MTDLPFDRALLFIAGLLAGALNSVAGGGSFITLPALLFLGVRPVLANTTSTVALWPGSVASAIAYRKDVQTPRDVLVGLASVSLVGGIIGAMLLLGTSDATFIELLPWLMLVGTVLFSFGGRLTARLRERAQGRRSAALLGGALLAQLATSIYGGYFGGGIGILMLATLSILGMTHIHAMNGVKAVLGSIINGVAVAAFLAAGAVEWGPGLAVLAGATLGGWTGARVARRIAPDRVRTFVILIAWSMTLYFFIAT